MLKDTQHSGQAGVRTHDLWVTSKVPCSRTHNAVIRPGFELTTFGLRVKCLAQGHTTQLSGRGSNSLTFGLRVKYLAQGHTTQWSGRVRTHDLWVTSKVPCSRTHNAVVRPGFELTTFGLRVKSLAQGHTTQWSGRVRTHDLWVTSKVPCSRTHNAVVRPGSNSRPLGYE